MQMDLPGPDGRMYPNFTWAGLPNDVEVPERVFNLSEYGVRGGTVANEGIERAMNDAVAAGGGVLQFGSGTFFLDRPLLIPHSNIVLRGMGRGARWKTTNLEFRYKPPHMGVELLFPRDGQSIHPESYILAAADSGLNEAYYTEGPNHKHLNTDNSRQLAKLSLYANNTLIREHDTIKHNHHAPQTSIQPWVHHMWNLKLKDGDQVTLRAVAEWKNGDTSEDRIQVTVDASLPDSARAYGTYAAISFAAPLRPDWERFVERNVTADIQRGDVWIELESAEGFAVQDYVQVTGGKPDPDAEDPNRYLHHRARIVEIAENRVKLDQPVRLNTPLTSGAKVRRLEPLRNSGIEHLTLKQTEDTWAHGIFFQNAWGCWVREVEVINAGRNPIVFNWSKHCLIQDVLLNGARYPNNGGSSAYFGWSDNAMDCLAERVTTVRLRHSPNFQGVTSGCVIRDSIFENSDLQWHAFHPYENLIENCRVFSAPGSGSYGYAAYAVKPGGQHGIAGPRNVVWGNDLISTHKGGVYLGGLTRDWSVVHNRIRSRQVYEEAFAALLLGAKTSGTLFAGNWVEIEAGRAPVLTMGEDGGGNRVEGNTFVGAREGQILDGDWDIELENNRFPDADSATEWEAPRSLFLYQKRRVTPVQDVASPQL